MPWSYTKIDTFKTCPYKFKLQYLDRIPQPLDNAVALHKGSLVHLLLERKINNDTDLEDPELLDLLNKLAKEDIMKILRSVKKFIDGDFWNQLNFNQGKAEEFFYLDSSLSPCSKPNAVFSGKIDYREKKDDYILIIDWKTGKKTQKEVENYKADDLQLDIYALWALQKFPEFEAVNAMLYYVETGAHLERAYSKASIEELKSKVAAEVYKIGHTTEFARNLGPLCDYCGYFSEYCNSKA